MPYTKDKLPDQIKGLPEHAQDIWISSFNSAYQDNDNNEETAMKIAWSSVKEKYEKKGDIWRTKGADGNPLVSEPEILDRELNLIVRMDVGNFDGSAWEVTICESGHTKNGWFLPENVLKAVADEGLFNNVDVCMYELPQGATHLPEQLFDVKSLLVRNKVGFINNVRFVAGEVGKLVGDLRFLDSAKWLGGNLLKAKQAGQKIYGLSYDALTKASRAVMDNKKVMEITRFVRPDSLDIVSRPAAGGAFNRAIAALLPKEDSEIMKKEELWNLIQEKRPDLLIGRTLAETPDEEVSKLARMAMEPSPAKPDDTTPPNHSSSVVTSDELKKIREEQQLFRCEMALRDALSGEDLPEFTRVRIKRKFENRIFDPKELQEVITDEKQYLSQMAKQAQKDQPEDFVPFSSVHVGMGSYERACMAVDKMMGLTQEQIVKLAKHRTLKGQPFFRDDVIRSVQDCEAYDDIPSFSGLLEMYTFFSGDPEVTGRFNRKKLPIELRSRMDINSGTFTYILGNTLSRRIVATYKEMDFGEDLVVSTTKAVNDFRTQEATVMGYFGNIDNVDPESEDYQEIGTVTDEEATYTVGQKGNILTLTRKFIINDDISALPKIIDRFGRSARRTHGEYVWDFWVNNSNCSDGTAWHTSGHGNLGDTALSFSTFATAYTALAKMTEKDSGKRMGLLQIPGIKPVLIGPVDIEAMMKTIADDPDYHTGADDRTTKRKNPYYGRVTWRSFAHLTDTNDWGLIIPGSIVDHLEMGYLKGRQEPEFFVADSPQSEQMFVADKTRYKVRHEYGGTPVDYRGSYKAEVT